MKGDREWLGKTRHTLYRKSTKVGSLRWPFRSGPKKETSKPAACLQVARTCTRGLMHACAPDVPLP